MTERLHELARSLQPFFLEEPPNLYATGWSKLREGRRAVPPVPAPVGRPALGPGAVRDRLARRVRRTALRVRRGPAPVPREQRLRDARAALPAGDGDRAAVPHALRRRAPHPGLQRPRDRRDGLDHAGDGLGRPRRGRRDPHGAEVARIDVRDGRATGVTLEDGTEIAARTVLSNADPKRTFLGLVEKSAAPRGLPRRRRGDRDGRSVREGELRRWTRSPAGHGMPEDADPNRRSLATLVPTLEGAQRMYDRHRWGEIPDELWVDCVTASNVDDTLAPPGTHVMTAFVQYVPFELRSGTWDERRDELGRKVVETISRYSDNVAHVDPRDAGRHAAGPRTHLRADRGQHLPRRPERRTAVLHAPAARLVAVPDADRRAVPVRRRHASGWRRDRRARLRLLARGPEGPEAAAARDARVPCPNCGAAPAHGVRVRRRGSPASTRPTRRPTSRGSSCPRTSRVRSASAGSTRSAAGAGSPSPATPGRTGSDDAGPVAVRGARGPGARDGDTVASALFRAGVRTFTRSLKSHRRRGLYCGTGDCPNCLVTVDGVPGVRACVTPAARRHARASASRGWPSAEHDLLHVADRLHRLMPVGFYYKTFIRPRFAWRLAERRDPPRDGFGAAARRRAGRRARSRGTPDATRSWSAPASRA